jgi:hypothetical protein
MTRLVDQPSAVHRCGAASCNGGWRCADPPYTLYERIHQGRACTLYEHINHLYEHIHQGRACQGHMV